jgi:hypothetical protein
VGVHVGVHVIRLENYKYHHFFQLKIFFDNKFSLSFLLTMTNVYKVHYFDRDDEFWKIYLMMSIDNHYDLPYNHHDITFDDDPDIHFRFYGFREYWNATSRDNDVNLHHAYLIPLVEEDRLDFHHIDTFAPLITIDPFYPPPYRADQSIDHLDFTQRYDVIQLPTVSFLKGDFSRLNSDHLISADLSLVVTGHQILLRRFEMTNRFYRFPIIRPDDSLDQMFS